MNRLTVLVNVLRGREVHVLAISIIIGLLLTGYTMSSMAANASNSSAAPSSAAVESANTLIIRNLARPGAIEVENAGPDIDLAWKSIIEQEVEGQWHVLPVEFELIESCGAVKKSSCLHLQHGAVIRPVPWTGYSCSSQCNQACRANVYLGPGVFRFVVASCDGRRQWRGPTFKLGEYQAR